MSSFDTLAKESAFVRARAALCSVPFAPIIPAEDAMLQVIANRDEAGASWAAKARDELPWPWVRNRVAAWHGMQRECMRLERLPEGLPAVFPGVGRWTGL